MEQDFLIYNTLTRSKELFKPLLFETVYEMIKKYRGRQADFNRDYIFLDAKAMLRTSKYTVREITDELHFSNTSFPGKYFREAVGCSLLSH